jgi:SET domain-containing protein
MNKQALLQQLATDTYVMLKPSAIEGVGVFAIRNIPKGCRHIFAPPDAPEDWLTVSKNEIEALPEHAQFLVGNYCLFDDENYYVPAHGFKKMDVSLYLNHSDTPNIASINDGDYFEALRDIAEGEELFVDYGSIV